MVVPAATARVDDAQLLEGMLSKLESMVTLLEEDGRVIYQNASSLATWGDLSLVHDGDGRACVRLDGSRRSAGVPAALRQLFQLEHEKLGELEQSLEAGEVRGLTPVQAQVQRHAHLHGKQLPAR